MGSSQSQPTHNASPPTSSTPQSQSPASAQRPPSSRRQSGSLSRFSSLRRLSTLGRRDSDIPNVSSSKRLRQGSSTSDSPLGLGVGGGSREEGKKKKHRKSSSIFSPKSDSTILNESPRQTDSPMHSSGEFSAPTIVETPDEAMEEIIEATSSLNPSSSNGTPVPPLASYPQPSFSVSPPLDEMCPAITQPNPPISSSASLSPSPSPASIPLPSTPSSETSDPLAEERLRSISTIRETLGTEWPNGTSPSPAVERLLHRLRRSTSSPDLSNQSSSSSPHQHTQRTMSDRLTALLGFSTPGESSQTSIPPTSAAAGSESTSTMLDRMESNEATIDELNNRLAEAREELAETERQLNETRERMDNVRNRRPPSGAVLIIQGLAQTSSEAPSSLSDDEISNDDIGVDAEGSGERRRRRPLMRNRRSSEGSHTGTRRSRNSDTANDGSSIETQARMIGGLLTVAAAATATTLLAPSSPPPPSTTRSPAASALESLVNRLRPRSNRTQSVEAALSGYLRTALQSSREGTQSQSSTASSDSTEGPSEDNAEIISSDFQRFLEGVQGDLVGAVREFAGPAHLTLPTNVETTSEAADGTAAATTTSDVEMREAGEEESFVTAPSSAPTPVPPTPVDELPQTQAEAGPSTPSLPTPSTSTIPTFHRQLGQTLPRAANGIMPQITGGADGQPRRLDFFRAHMFPPVPPSSNSSSPAGEGTQENEGDEIAMVPCIFIGVRSIRHDPNMTTDDLVQHPSFPFIDGQVPPPQTTTGGSPALESTEPAGIPDISSSPLSESTSLPIPSPALSPASSNPALPTTSNANTGTTTERRSLRERFMDRLNPSRTAAARTGPRSTTPLNTYLVYVIGGNYPRNHPILSIPNLITGGPLTNEEMNLIGELMGQVKPPTVDQNEIEKSGLKIVKGSEMGELNKDNKLLDICVDRCLICLSDYEPEDECRILNCRHGYHKECVDQWLSKGRNSCPACRSEAVDTKKTAPATEPSTSGPSAVPTAGETRGSPMQVDGEDAGSSGGL